MRRALLLVAAVATLLTVADATPAAAGEAAPAAAAAIERNAPLFVNLTSDDPHRALMAVTFAANQLQRGHPVTIFLNDRGVRVAVADGGDTYAAVRERLIELLRRGGTVLACPMCTAHYGLSAEAYLTGVDMSSPERSEAALFAPGTRALSW